MKRLIAALKQFINQVYKDPSWDLATIVFIACFSFIITYHFSNPEELAQLETSSNEREAWIADAGMLCTLQMDMLSGTEAVTQPLNQYQNIYKAMVDTGMFPDHERIEENYNSVTKAKRRIELIAARLKGYHFSVPVHNEQARRYEAILANELSMLKLIEDFCAAFLTDDVEKFAQQLRDAGGKLSAVLKENETIDALEQGINLRREEQLRTNLTKNKKAKAQARILTDKKYVYILTAVFCIGYFIAFGRGVSKVLKTPCPVSSRQKRAVPKPKKRRNH